MYSGIVPSSIQTDTECGSFMAPSRKNPNNSSTLGCLSFDHRHISLPKHCWRHNCEFNHGLRGSTGDTLTFAKEMSPKRKCRIRFTATFVLCLAPDRARYTSHDAPMPRSSRSWSYICPARLRPWSVSNVSFSVTRRSALDCEPLFSRSSAGIAEGIGVVCRTSSSRPGLRRLLTLPLYNCEVQLAIHA